MATASLHGLDMAKAMRLKEIQEKQLQFPGRAIHGTGLTGLSPNDAQGYSDMLNEQVEGMNLENEAEGRAPVSVRQGFDLPSQSSHGIADDPTSSFNTSTGPYGAFGAGTGGQSAALIPPAQRLAGLSGRPQPEIPGLNARLNDLYTQDNEARLKKPVKR